MALEDDKMEELGSPIWITELFVDRPFTVIVAGMVVIIGFLYLAFHFETYIPSQITNRDFLDYSHENTLDFDMREAAQYEIQDKFWDGGMMPL